MSDGSDSNKSKKGFSGFDDLVTEVSEPPQSLKRAKQAESRKQDSETAEADYTPPYGSPLETNSKGKFPENPAFRDPISKKTKYIIVGFGLTLFIGYLTVLYLENNQPVASVTANTSSSDSVPTTSSTEPTPAPAPIKPAKKSYINEDIITEEMPPIGDGRTFNNSQIAYCISEKIRVEAMHTVIDRTDNGEIQLYNNAVDDFNSRCAHYRYRRGSVEYVRGKVEVHRHELENEGKRLVTNIRR